MNRFLIAFLVFCAAAPFAAVAQRYNAVETSLMAAYDELPNPAPIPQDKVGYPKVLACVNANNEVGKEINRASWNTTTREISRGGSLTFDEAEAIRDRIHNETAYTRELLRRYIAAGDVEKCNNYRDHAVQIIRDIMIPVK